MNIMFRAKAALVTTVVVACASSLGAQMPVPTAGPRTLVGIVSDTAGVPIDSAEIFISSLKRRVMSTADGRFRFDDIKPGTYDVSARRLGYLPQVRKVKVADEGGAISFQLVPYVRGLAPVVTSSMRGGLSGVVGDTSYRSIAGAEISAMATDRRTVSDSTGSFFLDLKPGKHIVRVNAPGFTTRLVSVTIPADSGRRVVVWLSPIAASGSRRDDWLMDSLNSRLLRRNPVWSKIYTREDIVRSGMAEATELATVGANKRVDGNCPAIIDGGTMTAPVGAFSAAEIEMMETYTPKPARYAPTSIMSRGHLPAQPSSGDCPITVYIWLRK
jgi:hypothetical protein